jgi:hypothetical protein
MYSIFIKRRRGLMKFFKVWIGVVVILALIPAVALAAGGGSRGGKSETVTMTTPTLEPIEVIIQEANKEETDEGFAVFPGEPLEIIYIINNEAPVEYILEVHPNIVSENAMQSPQIRLFQMDQILEQKGGPIAIHLLLGGGQSTRMKLTLTWPRSMIVNPLPKAFVTLYALRTDCVVVETCPWG